MAKRRGNNEGGITKRKDGRFQGYVNVGYDPVTGKTKKQYFYSRDRQEIQDKMRETLNRVNNGIYKEPSKMKVAEWFNIWIEEYQKPPDNLRQTTWESYKMQIDRHILPSIGHLYLSQLQTHDLQKLINSKRNDGARLDGKPGPLSARTTRYIHMICHACLEQARKEGRITVNPAGAVKLPEDKKKDIRYLDTEHVKILLSAAKQTKHFPAYYLELNTGLRRGELLALRWEDIDFEEGFLSVNRGIVRTKAGLQYQEPKTKRSKRIVGISEEVINTLKAHKKLQNEEKLSCPRGFTRHFERLLERAGLEKIPFHALRHTFATLSLQQGTDARTIQEALGHHKAEFTMDVYAGVTAKMKKSHTDRIGRLMAACLE